MAISLSKFKSLLKDLKQKIPLLFLEALCTFFSCCQKRRGRRSPVSSFQRPARAFPGLCSKPWQTSKADTDGSCLEWWRQNQTTSGPKFLSSQAEEEVVRTQPITPQNGNLRCPKLKGINSTATQHHHHNHSTHNHIPRQQVHPHPPIINQDMPSQIILWLYNLTVTHCKDAQ